MPSDDFTYAAQTDQALMAVVVIADSFPKVLPYWTYRVSSAVTHDLFYSPSANAVDQQ